MFKIEIESPVGVLHAYANSAGLTHLYLNTHRHDLPLAEVRENEVLELARTQLNEYFAGERKAFDLPIDPKGTTFQLSVWKELLTIPFGVTISYGDLAKRMGDPKLSRAVGTANGANPISIIVPCHRVIATNGHLTGYAGGIEKKRWLLDFETFAS